MWLHESSSQMLEVQRWPLHRVSVACLQLCTTSVQFTVRGSS